MTKEEAQEKANADNLLDPAHHCPLINDLCRSDCVCWQKGYVAQLSTDNFYANKACCNNGMFWRECNHSY